MGGWAIGVVLPGEDLARLFAVAESSQQRAIEIVSKSVGVAAPEVVSVAGPISQRSIELYGLKTGEVFDMSTSV